MFIQGGAGPARGAVQRGERAPGWGSAWVQSIPSPRPSCPVIMTARRGPADEGIERTVGQLADITGLDPVYVSKLVRALQGEGFVTRAVKAADSRRRTGADRAGRSGRPRGREDRLRAARAAHPAARRQPWRAPQNSPRCSANSSTSQKRIAGLVARRLPSRLGGCSYRPPRSSDSCGLVASMARTSRSRPDLRASTSPGLVSWAQWASARSPAVRATGRAARPR